MLHQFLISLKPHNVTSWTKTVDGSVSSPDLQKLTLWVGIPTQTSWHWNSTINYLHLISYIFFLKCASYFIKWFYVFALLTIAVTYIVYK